MGKDRAKARAAQLRRLCCTVDDVTSLVKPEWIYLNQEVGARRSNRASYKSSGLGGGGGGQGELSASSTSVPWQPIKRMRSVRTCAAWALACDHLC